MHKQWNIIKIRVKMTRDPGNPGSRDRTGTNFVSCFPNQPTIIIIYESLRICIRIRAASRADICIQISIRGYVNFDSDPSLHWTLEYFIA